jgi:hypothetical protein
LQEAKSATVLNANSMDLMLIRFFIVFEFWIV